MCRRLSWFLNPGGWSKTTAVGLYFIFPGIYILSLHLIGMERLHEEVDAILSKGERT
ncbi:hypothetical protein STEG23_018847, partial [Scotinomys teguina]